MKIKPLNNYITGTLLEKPPEKIKTFDKERLADMQWMEVDQVGPGHPDIANTVIPIPINPGVFAYCMAHGIVVLEDKDVILSEFDILGYLNSMDDDIKEFVPLGNLISIEPEPNEVSSIASLDQYKKKPSVGKVIKLGTGWRNMNGDIIPFQVQVGDRISYMAENTMIVRGGYIGKTDLQLISHADIKGVVI